MANRRWNGGATAVAQVSTLRVTASTSGDTITVTLTAEDGTTQSVVSTLTQNNNDNHAAALIQSNCAASSQSLFQQVTFTVATDTVTMTADLAGRPFYPSKTDSGTSTSTLSTTTASAGPNDWNTAANWSGSTVPVDNDLVVFSAGSFDALYGMDQSAIQLGQLSVTSGFSGNIGTASAALRIDTDGTGENTLNLGGSGTYYNFSGDFPIIIITRNLSTTKITGELDEIDLTGAEVGGQITLDATATIGSDGADINMNNVSPACRVIIPSTAVETGHIVQDSGIIELSAATKSAKSTLLLSGSGTFITKGSGVVQSAAASVPQGAITVLGGLYRHESDANLSGSGTTIAQFSGTVDFSKVKSSTSAEFLTMGNLKLYGGLLNLGAEGNLVSYSDLVKSGGQVIQPASDIASTSKRS